MEEIKVGEWVRFLNGKIAKVYKAEKVDLYTAIEGCKFGTKKDGFELFTKYGFNPQYYCGDKVWEKQIRKGLFYKECLIIWWKDREIQIRNNGQILLNTLYDLITAGLVEKVKERN